MKLNILIAITIAASLNFCLADYALSNLQTTYAGWSGNLDLIAGTEGPFGGDIEQLELSILCYSQQLVRITISDRAQKRWRVPYVNKLADPKSMPHSMDYKVSFTESGAFGFSVERADGRGILFNSIPGDFKSLVFEDQYIELSTQIDETEPVIYGLGERIRKMRLDTNNATYTLWNKDVPDVVDTNLYGSHALYTYVRKDTGLSHGVFMLNSNAMDVVIRPGALTYKMIGGVIDLFIMTGPSPNDVVMQYTSIVGTPHMPPYWALGFHQCRWGYKTVNESRAVFEAFVDNNLPLDTMWNDLDYMDGYRDFTLDPVRYPAAEMQQYIADLHASGRHYIPIIDPGIKREPGYFAFDALVQSGAYIRDNVSEPFVGEVWPGLVIFPDFTDSRAVAYWQSMIQTYHDLVPVDGLWIDMNEISNFCNGECHKNLTETTERNPAGVFDPNNPPFLPGGSPLQTRTVSMDAVLSLSTNYNLHNLFGFTESMATMSALENIRGKRSVVISRSSFPGSGHVAGHWTGDNYSTFQSMASSIGSILNFAMYGISLVGSDICGFQEFTTAELCTRWMQLGSLYPFSRNHNAIGMPPQEPYVFGNSTTNIIRAALNTRYQLLPFFYTLFQQAHAAGLTVVQPLYFEWPSDEQVWDIDEQFLIGHAILVSPVLQDMARTVDAYFADGIWYDFYSGLAMAGGTWRTLKAPLETINMHVRGGIVIPMQENGLTTTESRKLPYKLLVAPDYGGSASGQLYVDDGESLDMSARSTQLYFTAVVTETSATVKSMVTVNDYADFSSAILGEVRVFNIRFRPTSVQINGAVVPYQYDITNQVVTVTAKSNFSQNLVVDIS